MSTGRADLIIDDGFIDTRPQDNALLKRWKTVNKLRTLISDNERQLSRNKNPQKYNEYKYCKKTVKRIEKDIAVAKGKLIILGANV